MAADLGELWITIKANTTRLASEIQRDAARAGEDAGASAGGGFARKFAGAAAAVGGATLVADFLRDASAAASDLNETVSKTANVFGSAGQGVLDWSKDSATAFGMSQQQALDAASSFGAMFVQLGQSEKAAAANSEAVVKLAADLGSFNNLGTDEVVDMMSSAFRGEYDSIQRVLPAINGTAVANKALEQTGKKSAAALTEQEKAAAVLTLAQEQGALAADDFAETQDGVANHTKIVQAQFADLQAVIGGPLNRVVSIALDVFSSLIGVLTGVATWVGEAWAWMVKFQTPLKVVAGVILTLLLPAMTMLAVQAAVAAAANVVAFASIVGGWLAAGATAVAMSLVMAAAWIVALGPVGLIIAAVAAVVAVLVLLWKKVDWFREFWTAVWETLQEAVAAVVDWLVGTAWPFIKKVCDWIAEVVGWVVGAVKIYLAVLLAVWITVFTKVWDVVKWVFDKVWAFVQWAMEKVWNVVQFYIGLVLKVWDGIRAIWTWVSDIFGRVWTYIRDTVTAIWQVIWDKIGPVVTFVRDTFSGVYSAVRDWLGRVASFVGDKVDAIVGFFTGMKDRVVDAGKNMVRGLWEGIQSMWGWIKDKIMGFVKDALPDVVEKALGIHSPSRVFARIGQNVVLGLRQGIAGERTGLLGDMAALVPAGGLGWAGGAGPAAAPASVQVFIGDERLEARMVRVQQAAAADQAGRLVSAGV